MTEIRAPKALTLRMRRILTEPLLHFLAMGALVFMLYAYFNDGVSNDDGLTIVIDRENLLDYIQYRSGAFDRKRFAAMLDSLSDQALEGIMRDYSREEALYREAKALGLDRNDYVSRLRLIQQLEFVTRGFLSEEDNLSEAELEEYYEQHKTEFFVAPRVTFTHVFFDEERHGPEGARNLALAELEELNAKRISFEQASAFGDRFLYQLNYVQRGADEVASDFGVEMQQALFGVAPSATIWRGPFRSPYGYHVVLLTWSEKGFTPTLGEIREQVMRDAVRADEDARFERAIQRIVQSYRLSVQPGIRAQHAS